jgi:hypothetical protein
MSAVFDFDQIAAFLNSEVKLQGVYETRVAGHPRPARDLGGSWQYRKTCARLRYTLRFDV